VPGRAFHSRVELSETGYRGTTGNDCLRNKKTPRCARHRGASLSAHRERACACCRAAAPV